MRKHYLQHAPRGVTGLRLKNGEEAIYLDGEYVAGRDLQERNEDVLATGEKIAEKLGVPFRLLEVPVPVDDEWSWNDITDSLGWGKSIIAPRMMLRPVMECRISHITLEDNYLLQELTQSENEWPWILDTDVGYLLRLDAPSYPLLRLKRLGISRTTRALIYRAIQQADISMIHFSSVGDEVEGAEIFSW
ncbi:TPA: hypothetical protein R0C45_004450 [Kluyvera ascorbata F0526]|nr:hypothetical protein [Kluyvera ascorbata F0526]